MLISMTGFGQGEASDGTSVVSIEIRTVNHRFLDFSFKLPRSLNHRERDIKEYIRARIARGRVYVVVSVENETSSRSVRVNDPLMVQYLTLLRGFAEKHGVKGDVDINTLAQMPDIFAAPDNGVDDESLWPLVKTGLDQALDRCMQMRVAEGKMLEKDLKARISAIEKTVARIEKLAPEIAKKHALMFRKRIAKLVDNASVDNDRLTTEIALMADRLDVTEELIRLRSHLDQFKKAVAGGGEVSKKLTYLLQEMHREASTIGAKASDSKVIQHVVALKEETEKLREQAQNIE